MGYETYRFLQTPSKHLLCAICTDVAEDPVCCDKNEHMFCRVCIEKWLRVNQTCPMDQNSLTSDNLSVPRVIRNMIQDLDIKCRFVSNGCPETTALEEEDRHALNCEFNDSMIYYSKLDKVMEAINELKVRNESHNIEITVLSRKFDELTEQANTAATCEDHLRSEFSSTINDMKAELFKELSNVSLASSTKVMVIKELKKILATLEHDGTSHQLQELDQEGASVNGQSEVSNSTADGLRALLDEQMNETNTAHVYEMKSHRTSSDKLSYEDEQAEQPDSMSEIDIARAIRQKPDRPKAALFRYFTLSDFGTKSWPTISREQMSLVFKLFKADTANSFALLELLLAIDFHKCIPNCKPLNAK